MSPAILHLQLKRSNTCFCTEEIEPKPMNPYLRSDTCLTDVGAETEKLKAKDEF